jgi:hypothetical protein
MSGVSIALVGELVAASLAAWGLAGVATRTDDGAVAIEGTSGNKTLRIEPKPDDAMFRGLVKVDGGAGPAISLVAVLRQVHAALDPDFAAKRVRVGMAPLLVS